MFRWKEKAFSSQDRKSIQGLVASKGFEGVLIAFSLKQRVSLLIFLTVTFGAHITSGNQSLESDRTVTNNDVSPLTPSFYSLSHG